MYTIISFLPIRLFDIEIKERMRSLAPPFVFYSELFFGAKVVVCVFVFLDVCTATVIKLPSSSSSPPSWPSSITSKCSPPKQHHLLPNHL